VPRKVETVGRLVKRNVHPSRESSLMPHLN
jgi:hypothetical protein